MQLFAKAMLAAYKAYGPCEKGSAIEPIHLYRWTCEVAGVIVEDEYALWEYLSDKPLEDGWSLHDLTVAIAIKECGRDMLYVGGGAGRFSKAAATWGLACHCVDIAPDAIELMELRGVSCDLADGHNMPYEDLNYELCVVAPWVFDGSDAPQQLLAEAARIADRVIVSGWMAETTLETKQATPYRETIEWQGEFDERNAVSYHWEQVLEMFAAVGMVPERVVKFLPNLQNLDEVSWVIEARR